MTPEFLADCETPSEWLLWNFDHQVGPITTWPRELIEIIEHDNEDTSARASWPKPDIEDSLDTLAERHAWLSEQRNRMST